MSLHQKMCFRDNIVRITGLFLSGSQKAQKKYIVLQAFILFTVISVSILNVLFLSSQKSCV